MGSHGWQPRRAWITALRHGSHLGSHLGGPPPRPRRACATDHTLDHSPRHGGQPRMLPYSHGQPRSATVPWITNPRRARIPSKSLRRSNRLRGCQGRATGLKPISERARNKSLVETGLTPTWELANGQKTAKARLAADGAAGPRFGTWACGDLGGRQPPPAPAPRNIAERHKKVEIAEPRH